MQPEWRRHGLAQLRVARLAEALLATHRASGELLGGERGAGGLGADGDQDTATLTINVPEGPDVEGLPLIVDASPNNGDVLNGTADAEILAGDDGNDTLNGLGGNDLLFGGDGVLTSSLPVELSQTNR